MPEPRAQRTLVKSPPELWAEISDVSTLARHLGEFGDIRITRLEAETTVVWEGDRARGTVNLEPSGWGTKVTMTAEAIAVEDEAPAAVEPEVVAEAEPEPEPEPEPVAIAEPEPVEEPEPRRVGLFARLFGRKAKAPEPEPAVVVVAEPLADEALHTPTLAAPEPEPEPPAEPEAAAPEPAPEPDLEAVLVGVLDDLGSAHHRPFSRG